MPIGPNGEKRPSGVIENAVLMCRIATGQAEEEYVDTKKSEAGKKGSRSRAEKVTPERRKEIAEKAAATRWEK